MSWKWERDDKFDAKISLSVKKNRVQWVDFTGNPMEVGGEVTANGDLRDHVKSVERGECVGHVKRLAFRDPGCFCAGELHNHIGEWEELVSDNHSPMQAEVLGWIRHKVSIKPFFQPFRGKFKGEEYNSALPPSKVFRNNMSCKPFVEFIRVTLLDRVKNGAVSVVGKVGTGRHPHLVLPLTMEPTKPRLCYDARYVNLWMQDKPFSLDSVKDVPRYVSKDHYQSVIDDKSGYDHILLSEDSLTYFGFQWGGWYFTYNTIPFGWKISPYVYHNTGLVATDYFRSLGIPCLLYIDDRHNGQLQVPLNEGEYMKIKGKDEKNLAVAQSTVFVVAYYLIQLGYFLGLKKSILEPRKIVPYLGFFGGFIE